MLAIDTNVVVRYLTRDDARQATGFISFDRSLAKRAKHLAGLAVRAP